MHSFFLFWVAVTTTVTFTFGYQYTAVPPSTNPSSKENMRFLQDLQTQVDDATTIEVTDGRIRFSLPRSIHTLTNFTRRSPPRSIRLVVQETRGLDSSCDISSIVRCVNCRAIQEHLSIFCDHGNVIDATRGISFRLTCRRHQDSICSPNISMSNLTRALASKISKQLGWKYVSKKRDHPQLDLTCLLQKDQLWLESTLLVRPLATNELPKPGFKRPESWAVARAAHLASDSVVLDPMCGRATFLVEAATFWPNATYLGVDICERQLQDAQANVVAANVQVQLCSGNACQMTWLENHSIDRILCCPPFFRQFGKEEEKDTLYNDLMKEWFRVLKSNGEMVLVIDQANLHALQYAIERQGGHVAFVRDFFRLGKLRATIVVASAEKNRMSTIRGGKFDWEKGETDQDRALWTRLRSQSLPPLVPFHTG